MGKGAARRKKIPSSLRKIIASNVKNRAKEVFPKAKNVPVAIAEASRSARVHPLVKSTVQRIMAGDDPKAPEDLKTSATLEQLEGLADALQLVAAYQLLIPNLDAKNPQVAKGATTDERDLYRRLEKVEQALSKSEPGMAAKPVSKK